MATTIEFLNKTVQKKQGSLAFAWLADRELEAGNALVAAEILEEGLARFPDFVPGMFVKAKVLRQQQKAEDAEALLRMVLDIDPLHLAAQKNLVQVCIDLKRGPDAHSFVSRLRELDSLAPDFPAIPEDLASVEPMVAATTTAAPQGEFFIEREQLFASLEDAFLEETVAGDEKSAAELQSELEAALAGTPAVEAEQEYFPADDPSLPAGAVSNLFTQMFGGEEAPSATAAPPPAPEPTPVEEINTAPAVGSFFSSFTPPAPVVAPEPEATFEAMSEAQSIPVPEPRSSEGSGGIDLASALDELFGDDDDLPVEGLGSVPAPPPVSAMPEVSEIKPTDDGLTGGVADALGDLFGEEDDLPIEGQEAPGPAVEPPSESSDTSLFEKTEVSEIKPTDDGLTGGVADALGNLFGTDDDLPTEGATESTSRGATTMEELLGGAPEGSMDTAESSIELQSLADSLYDETPAPAPLDVEDDFREGVANALGGLFGESEELPAQSIPLEESPFADLLASDDSEAHDEGASLSGDLAQALIEDPTAPVSESVPVRDSTPVPAKSEDDTFSGGMSNALTDLFGAELDEDLSDLMEDKQESTAQGSTWTLGELYLEQGHPAEALQVFQELLIADPVNEQLRQKIAEVQQRIDSAGTADSQEG